jgi:nicotinic acid phosphoribosyltransferase
MKNPAIGTSYPEQRQAFNAILLQWMHLIAMIIGCFSFDPVSLAVVGVAEYAITASCYNDYYKLSMAPTIHLLQKLRGGRAVVRFALDIRDKNLRDMFAANTDGIKDALIQALNALQHRTFDYQVILDTVAGKPFEAFFHSPEGRALFLNADGTPRTLISTTAPHGVPVYPGTVICSVPILNPRVLAPGQVVISVFEENDAKTGERRLHVEAAGDASAASYLETTMMQAVYDTALNHHLSKRGCSFGQWLYEALFRFYLSATFAGTQCPGMTGFLFAGRRTGHFLLLLLQAFLAKKIPGAKIAGTSSFDAVHFLTKKLRLTDIIGSVGTHAHEIQMLAQSLYAWLDKHAGNPEHLPLSACVSTYLYYLTAHQGKPGPMPMLPDTLGTRAFCKAAACFMVRPMKDGVLMEGFVPLLSLINSARQDSGDISEFARTVRQYGFQGGLMASEVDDAEKLIQARDASYTTFGAGGFMGDSEKVWKVTDDGSAFTASMAVKVVDVWFVRKSPCGTAEVSEKCLSPCKLGDGTELAKVTADALLPKPMYNQVIADAQLVKSSAETKPVSDHQFFCEVDLVSFRITVIRDPGSSNPVQLI